MLRIQGVEMSHETHLVIFVIQFRKEAGTPLTRLLSWLTQNLMRAAPSKNQQQVPLAAWHRANGPLGKAESYSNSSLLVGALSSCTASALLQPTANLQDFSITWEQRCAQTRICCHLV